VQDKETNLQNSENHGLSSGWEHLRWPLQKNKMANIRRRPVETVPSSMFISSSDMATYELSEDMKENVCMGHWLVDRP
jgi:hypothetical protein